jgi:hypothetical protein
MHVGSKEAFANIYVVTSIRIYKFIYIYRYVYINVQKFSGVILRFVTTYVDPASRAASHGRDMTPRSA